jgi:hypothetical protein
MDDKILLMTKMLKLRGGTQNTSTLRVSTHWESDGTSLSVLVEVRISYVLRFISISGLILSYIMRPRSSRWKPIHY